MIAAGKRPTRRWRAAAVRKRAGRSAVGKEARGGEGGNRVISSGPHAHRVPGCRRSLRCALTHCQSAAPSPRVCPAQLRGTGVVVRCGGGATRAKRERKELGRDGEASGGTVDEVHTGRKMATRVEVRGARSSGTTTRGATGSSHCCCEFITRGMEENREQITGQSGRSGFVDGMD